MEEDKRALENSFMQPGGQDMYRPDIRNDDDEEVNLKLMMQHVFKRWRTILVIGIMMCVLLGCLKLVKNYRSRGQSDDTGSGESGQSIEVQTYNTQKTLLEDSLQEINNQIEIQSEYMSHSILMQMDPNRVYRGHLAYYISTDYQVDPSLGMQSPDKTTSVIQAYMKAIEKHEFISTINDSLSVKVDSKYLRELISVDPDYDGSMIDIYAVGNSEELVDAIMEAARQTIASETDFINESISKHEIKQLSDETYITADTAASDNGGSYLSQSTNSIKGQATNIKGSGYLNVASAQKSNADVLNDLQNQMVTITQQIDQLKEPADASVSLTLSAGVLKYSLIGLIVGILLAMFFYAIRFVMTDVIHEEDELTDQYRVRILGSYYEPLKKRPGSWIDRQIDRMIPHSKDQDDLGKVMDAAAENVKHLSASSSGRSGKTKQTEGGPVILITGEDQKKASMLASRLEPDFFVLYAADIVNAADGIQKLARADQVILLVERDKTRRSSLETSLRQILAHGKCTVGAIMI